MNGIVATQAHPNDRISVQLVQLNSVYGKKIYVPYSVGMLKSYSEQYKEIRDRVEFRPLLYRRDSVESIVEQIGVVDILGLSGYVWNWRLSIAIAKEIRRCNPDCLIVVGGPHVPDQLSGFFDKYPFIDIACHGESEITFYEVLKAHKSDRRYKDILGLSYHDRITGEVTQNPKRLRIRDLDSIPSPYLNGTFDHLIENADNDAEWMVVWETNRGCPFSCTFCDWGSAIASKVNKFGMDRLYQEIEWFGRGKMTWIFGGDANFGILRRDKELVEALARTKREMGYPLEFRVCFTKNSDVKVFDIAKVLHDSNMSKGISLSMQSLNPATLQKIKRKNIKLDTFHQLQSRYLEEGMTNYTELIIGLPGETYQSFVDGIDTLLDNGQHNQINIYNCAVMPNAEMGDPEYQKAHKIQAIELPIFQPHSAPHETQDTIVEYEPIIISTATMSLDDWRRIYHFAWAVQCFHFLGIFQYVAIFLRNWHDIKYSTFYKAILRYGKENPDSLIGQEMQVFGDVLENVVAGIGFSQYVPQFSDITWPPEEASWLRFSENMDGLYAEFERVLEKFLEARGIVSDELLLDDLLLYQKSTVVRYDRSGDVVLELDYDLPGYIRGVMVGKDVPLERGCFAYRVVDNGMLIGDKRKFAHEVLWYGRKGGRFLYNTYRERND